MGCTIGKSSTAVVVPPPPPARGSNRPWTAADPVVSERQQPPSRPHTALNPAANRSIRGPRVSRSTSSLTGSYADSGNAA